METIIDNDKHRVVYIEYSNNLPHSVSTATYIPNATCGPYWCLEHFDFFPNNGDKTDIRYYNSGGGGDAAKLQPPHWCDGYIGEYWIDKEIADFKGSPINAKCLDKPKRIKGWRGTSINPFKVADETYSHEYCEECGFESTEVCWEHKYEDDKGNLRYFANDEICE